MRRWESDKHKSWSIPAGGFRDHVATDASLLGVAGKWSACGWSLDHDEEMGPMHRWTERWTQLEVQRTIKGAELTCSSSLLKKAIRPSMVHVDNRKIVLEIDERIRPEKMDNVLLQKPVLIDFSSWV